MRLVPDTAWNTGVPHQTAGSGTQDDHRCIDHCGAYGGVLCRRRLGALFSLGVLLLLGAAWTFADRDLRYWQQIRIYLNIGSVREGADLYEGLPWRVKDRYLHPKLENPDAGISQRIAIEQLVDLKSEPMRNDEPWFPQKDDWVILVTASEASVVGSRMNSWNWLSAAAH